jgi:hypothetical protein
MTDIVIVDDINQAFHDFEKDNIMNEFSFQNVFEDKSLFFHSCSNENESKFNANESEFNANESEFNAIESEFNANKSESDADQLKFDTKQLVDDDEFSEINQNDQISISSIQVRKNQKLDLKDLTRATQEKLLNIARKKVQSSIDEDEVMMNIREKSYHTSYTIKYLHSVTRFLITNVTLFLFSMKSSLKSHKSTSKSEMIRVYCDIARDNKRNKL